MVLVGFSISWVAQVATSPFLNKMFPDTKVFSDAKGDADGKSAAGGDAANVEDGSAVTATKDIQIFDRSASTATNHTDLLAAYMTERFRIVAAVSKSPYQHR